MHELVEKYLWADTEDGLALTITVIDNRTEDDVLGIFGGSRNTFLGDFAYWDAWVPVDDLYDYGHLMLMSHHDKVVAIEPNGWLGTIPEVARRASRDGSAFTSAYCTVENGYSFLQAYDGVVTTRFDVGDVDPAALAPDWAREDVDPYKTGAHCLAYLERETGVELNRSLLDVEMPTYRVLNSSEIVKGVRDAWYTYSKDADK